jgi:uncharacterized protein (DUF2062 family)
LLQGLNAHIRKFAATLLTERLDPASAGAAVFWGIFIGIVPIYGLQTLVAVSLAVLLRLNKPLTLAATFVNNPLLLPPIVAASVELGGFLRHGSFLPWHLAALSGAQLKEQLVSWVLGSLALGLVAGGAAAILTAAVVYWTAPSQRSLRERIRFVNQTFAKSAQYDRGFVRWKMRLDRIFSLLGSGRPGIWNSGRPGLRLRHGTLSLRHSQAKTAVFAWMRPECASNRRRPTGSEYFERGGKCLQMCAITNCPRPV